MKKTRSPKFNIIELLPVELQFETRDLLAYRDALMLSQVNRHFHEIVEPHRWPADEKAEFALKAQYFQQNNTYNQVELPIKDGSRTELVWVTDTASYACFTCYLVKPMESFSMSQIMRCDKRDQQYQPEAKKYTRTCVDCQIAEDSFTHGLDIRILSKIPIKIMQGDWILKAKLRIPQLAECQTWLTKVCTKCRTLHTQEEWDVCTRSVLQEAVEDDES